MQLIVFDACNFVGSLLAYFPGNLSHHLVDEVKAVQEHQPHALGRMTFARFSISLSGD